MHFSALFLRVQNRPILRRLALRILKFAHFALFCALPNFAFCEILRGFSQNAKFCAVFAKNFYGILFEFLWSQLNTGEEGGEQIVKFSS